MGLRPLLRGRSAKRGAIDADVSFAHARFSGVAANQTRIPGALENVVAGGITWNPPRSGPFGSVRLRHFGSYPLIEDNSLRAIRRPALTTFTSTRSSRDSSASPSAGGSEGEQPRPHTPT